MHPIDYSFFESEFEGQFGTTMLWDVGEYEVVTSAKSRKQGVDRDPDTDDEAESSQRIGWQHEKALRHAYRTRFSFTLILKGARHTSRLSFVSPHDPNQVGFAMSGVTRNITARRRWFVIQSPTDDGQYVNLERTEGIQGRSILTGRTMDEIQADMKVNGKKLSAELRGASTSKGMLQILKEKHDRMQHGEHHIALQKVFEEADDEEGLPAMQRAFAKRATVEVPKALRLTKQKRTGK